MNCLCRSLFSMRAFTGPSRRDGFEEPFGRQLFAQTHGTGAVQDGRTHRRELNARAGIVVVERDVVRAGAALDLAGDQLLYLMDRVPRDDAVLRGVPDIRRFILLRYVLGVND